MKKILWLLFYIGIVSTAFAQQQQGAPNQISGSIKGLISSEGRVLFGDEPNSLVVIDYPENLDRVSEYLTSIDVPPKQVLIEARVVEVKLQKEHSLGVNWQFFSEHQGFKLARNTTLGSAYPGAPGALAQTIGYKNTFYPPAQTTSGSENPFTVAIFNDNVNVVLRTLASALDTNILSAPRVTTVNNREAEIKVIQRLPWAEPEVQVSDSGTVTVTWTVNFEEVGISLKATPTINDDGTITMILNPEVSEKTSDYTLNVQQGSTSVPYTVPVIDKRSASTKVLIGNGQTLIIGGLIKDKITDGETKIPLLGDLPAVGYLFKSKKVVRDKTELLIFVSPTIITEKEFAKIERNERFGINKKMFDERDRQEQMALLLQHQEKQAFDKLSSQLDALAKKQESIVEERKKLEEKVNVREENIKNLQAVKQSVTEKRKAASQTSP